MGKWCSRPGLSGLGLGCPAVSVRSAFVLVGLLTLFMSSAVHSDEILLSGAIPLSVHEIELSYLGEQTTPSVTLNGPPDPTPSLPYRPFVPVLELLPFLEPSQVFGPCLGEMRKEAERTMVELTHREGESGRCGQRLGLQPQRGLLDVLAYGVVHLRGQATGRILVAMEDRASTRREESVPLTTVSGPFDLTIPLRSIGRQMDLRQLTAVVVVTDDSQARLVLEQFELSLPPAPLPRPVQIGFWVWGYRAAAADPDTVIAACQRQACSRILIQMPALSDGDALWMDYARVFSLAQQAGIEALALDGYPEAIQDPRPLAQKIRKLLPLVKPRALAGIQLDIEPYLLPGFFGDDSGPHRYLEAIDILREVIGGRTPLSIVIPFWLAAKTVGGRPLGFAVMDRADEVAVMSYRTNLDELVEIADDTLRYGDLVGTSVWLALETTVLPVERRVILSRDPRPDVADAVLDYDSRRLDLAPVPLAMADGHRRDWFRIHHRITVRPERLTFAGRSRAEVAAAIQTLRETLSHPSFAGVIIHDLDGFQALTD